MKFKAILTDHGVNLLEKRFVPSLDKIGRICHLYLTRDHAIFLHNLLNGDGIQSIAQFRKETLFDDYRISSQNDDRIAFAIDLGLLNRALRSSLTIEGGDRLQIKLVKKLPTGSHQPMPFLTFETKGYKSAVIQDVPISKPLSRSDVMELQAALDMAQDMPQTLVQVPDLVQLQNLVDRLKHVGDLLNVSITQYGDLHLQVSTSLITVGSEFRKLRILGVQADVPAGDQNLSARARTEMALQRGEAQSVQVSMKHFAKSLHCHLAKPDCAFYASKSRAWVPKLEKARAMQCWHTFSVVWPGPEKANLLGWHQVINNTDMTLMAIPVDTQMALFCDLGIDRAAYGQTIAL